MKLLVRDGFVITINGVIAHPGNAKGKMVNALKIAGEILSALPKGRLSPESTEGRDGFIHPVRVSGIAEQATIEFIIRDFITANLPDHENELKKISEEILLQYPGATVSYLHCRAIQKYERSA